MKGAGSVHVLGMAGSLRKGSFNAAALRAAQALTPAGMTLELFDLSPIPMFNQDQETDMPIAVQEFKNKIAQADALLFATPEYNYSFSGVLKNAMDWASRPLGKTSMIGKPAAIMGASVGPFGTALAQYQLRQVCVCFNMLVLNRPEICIAAAHEKFDAMGHLIHEETKEQMRAFLAALQNWVHRLDKERCK